MKIAIIAGPYVPIPPPKYGGTEQVIHYLIRGLIEAGHEPILIGPKDSTVECQVVPIVDTAIYFPTTRAGKKAHAQLVKKAQKLTTKRIKELLPSVDIVHSHGFDLLPFKDFPNVTTIHNKIEFEDIDYYLKRKKLNYVFISKNQQAALPDAHGINVVYNGEDPNDFPIVTEPEDYVCFLGRFDRDKSPHLAIQLAISKGIKIKLGGKMDHLAEGYFEEEVGRFIDHPLVEYLGELDFKAKVELLSKAKCNLHPTNFREPFGLTVLEAAYCGTPTLAVSRGSMPELIEPGRTGLIVEDFVEGRSYIDECFTMDRAYIASRARQLFNYTQMTKQYIESYEEVIKATPKTNYSHKHNAVKRMYDFALGYIKKV